MKRFVWLLFVALLVLFTVTSSVLADQPDPIDKLAEDDIPEVYYGQHHYLLLCVDQWNGKPGNLGNTDGIVLVTLDNHAKRIMLTSVIRDALVERPDGVIGRINYIAKNYSPEALCHIFATHLGVQVEKYILFDFSQIQAIINYLGGVDIEVTAEEISYLKRYAIPKNSTTPVLSKPGTYRFDGHAAVIYMRIRKAGGGGDFMRTQRVRTVLSSLADQCRSISYEDAVSLVDNVMSNTTMTNMNLDEMMEAMGYAYKLRGCTVEELRIPVDGASKAINYAAMSVQQIDWAACREAMQHYLQNSFLVIDED